MGYASPAYNRFKNVAYNNAARLYNAELSEHYTSADTGRHKFMRLVNIETGRFYNDSLTDTPASWTEMVAVDDAKWDLIEAYYIMRSTRGLALSRRRFNYCAFIGCN